MMIWHAYVRPVCNAIGNFDSDFRSICDSLNLLQPTDHLMATLRHARTGAAMLIWCHHSTSGKQYRAPKTIMLSQATSLSWFTTRASKARFMCTPQTTHTALLLTRVIVLLQHCYNNMTILAL